jgi:hypothetical protein
VDIKDIYKRFPVDGDWLWTIELLNSCGGVGRHHDYTLPSDIIISYGKVIFVGERIVVLQARDKWDTDDELESVIEWSIDKEHGQYFNSLADLHESLTSRRGWRWPNQEWKDWSDNRKDKYPSQVCCPFHGPYDSDELCWSCEKEKRGMLK